MKKLLTIIIFAAALLTLPTGVAFAQDPTPITGTVESVVPQTDPTTGETLYYVVTLTDELGTTHVVNISEATAESLGLITVDPTTGEVTINEVVDPVTIDPVDILPPDGTGEEEEEAEHPVGSKLGEFFGELVGVDYDIIMTAREEYGVGFGVIAQALWLTNQIDGGADEFEALLEAKTTHNYENIILADGSTPDNWGDVVKSLKKGENLGSVMSGKADEGSEEDTLTTESQTTNGRSNGNGGGSDKSNNGGGNDKGNNGKGNDKDNNGKNNGKGKP